MRASSILAIAAPLALLVSFSATARASEPFPAEVAARVPSLTCVPQCTLCHFQNPGMVPAGQVFALSLKQQSPVIPRDTASLAAALEKLRTAVPAPDSDGDGTSDYAELEAGTNPNLPDASARLCTVVPTYGCGATIAAKPQSDTDLTATLAAAFTLLAGLFALRRRKP